MRGHAFFCWEAFMNYSVLCMCYINRIGKYSWLWAGHTNTVHTTGSFSAVKWGGYRLILFSARTCVQLNAMYLIAGVNEYDSIRTQLDGLYILCWKFGIYLWQCSIPMSCRWRSLNFYVFCVLGWVCRFHCFYCVMKLDWYEVRSMENPEVRFFDLENVDDWRFWYQGNQNGDTVNSTLIFWIRADSRD